MTDRRIVRSGTAALALMVLASVVLTAVSAQAASSAFGRRERYGYFDNKFGHSDSPYRDGGGPVVDNGGDSTSNNAMPKSVNSKGEFMSWLKSRYSGSANGKFGHPTWDKRGIAFIVNTMIGRNGSAGDKSLDGGEWDELNDRLYNPDITIDPGTYSSRSFGGVDTFYQYGNQDVSWYNNDNESGSGIAFRYKGKIVYVILNECANPLGDLPGLPNYNKPDLTPTPTPTPSPNPTPNPNPNPNPNPTPTPTPTPVADWSIGVSTFANLNEATKRVEFNHTVRNNGPDTTTSNVTYAYVNGANTGTGNGPSSTYPTGRTPGDTTTFGSSVGYSDADAGKTFCRATTATPGGSEDAPGVTSAQACVTIPFNYSLEPHVTFSDGGTIARIDPGADVAALSSRVNNAGPTPSVPTTVWEVTRCQYAPGVAYPLKSTTTDSPSNASTTFGGICTGRGSGTQQFGVGTSNLVTTDEDAINLPVGTHICFILSVRPPSSSLGGYRHSVPACIAVLKTPKIQAWQGDVRAGSVTASTPRTIEGKTYGSWAAYGVLGVNAVAGMGSGASLAGGSTAFSGSRQAVLTFANNGSGACSLGCFYSQPPTDDYVTAYQALATESTSTTTRGGAVADGTVAIIRVNGDLTIGSDMTFGGEYADLSRVPRVIYVVSGNIIIADDVTRIDPWLIAAGTVYTCASFTDPTVQPLTASTCDTQLTFNGPVTAGRIILGRTFGADATPASRPQAAEIFNLAPANYLSGYAAGRSASNIQTVYEKELPPRL